MKTPDQIYNEAEARWSEKRAERHRAMTNRIIDMVLVVVPWCLIFAWSIALHQAIVAGLCVPLVVASCFQLQKWQRLEDRIDRLERQVKSRTNGNEKT